MPIVKRSSQQIRDGHGRVDTAKLDAHTDADLDRFAAADDSPTSDLGEARYLPPRIDVRALRQRLGVSQAEFARRYLLSVRTVQQWEQELREPSEPARVLLFAIERDPGGIERVLHKP